MKKAFKWGFIVGVIYIAIFAILIFFAIKNGGGEGAGMFVAIFTEPAGFIIFGILEYLLKLINLRDLVFNNFFVLWSLMALVQGVFFGLVFATIKKLYTEIVK